MLFYSERKKIALQLYLHAFGDSMFKKGFLLLINIHQNVQAQIPFLIVQ